MFYIREDNTYRDIREKSLMAWLDELEKHEDVAVRGGVALAKSYIASMKAENERLRRENQRKNTYLQKAVARKENE